MVEFRTIKRYSHGILEQSEEAEYSILDSGRHCGLDNFSLYPLTVPTDVLIYEVRHGPYFAHIDHRIL